jgi:hypothetical protein
LEKPRPTNLFRPIATNYARLRRKGKSIVGKLDSNTWLPDTATGH